MLDGLEISEVKISNLNTEMRFDAEYFSKHNIKLLKILKNKQHVVLGNVSYITDGIHTSIDYDENSKIKLLSATSPRENYFDLSRDVCISEKAHKLNRRTELLKDDVVISTVGTIGNCAVVDDMILPANSDRHVGIIRINKLLLPYYLSTFLLSEYGRLQTDREATGNVQLNLFLYKLREIIVPTFTIKFQEIISDNIRKAINKRYISERLIKKSFLLLKDILVVENSFKNNNVVVRTYKDTFCNAGRIDAEFYSGKYEVFESKVKKQKYKLLKDIADVIKGNLIDEKLYTTDSKNIKYIRGADIQNNILEKDKLIYIDKSYSKNNEYLTKIGDIVAPMIGSVGNIGLVVDGFDNSYISNNLGAISIKSSEIIPEYLYIYFSCKECGGLLFEKYMTRTAQPKISKEDIEKFIVPIISMEKQLEFKKLLKVALKNKNESKRLLDVAKRSVEIAIEKNEKEALNYIDNANVNI